MARNVKSGLDYFPLDVDTDDKFELIEAKHELIGFAIIIKLFQRIYKAGYYLEWNDEKLLIFKKSINVDINTINDVINDCLKYGIFNKALFKKYKILTSSGIQKRYFKACERRKILNLHKEFIIVDINEINVNINWINDDKSTQRKEEESKENKSKENNKEDEIPIDEKQFNYLEYHTYYDLVEHAKKEESWFNSLLRLLKLEKETILSELENFPIVQEAKGNKITNLKEFKNHFFNYMNLRKDDLRKVERKKSEISIVDRLEIERQKYFEILKK